MSAPEQVQAEQAQMIESIRRVTARAVAPAAARVDESCALPEGLWHALGEQGLAGLIVPACWGGIGADTPTFLAAVELLAAACGSTAWAFLAHCAAEQAILALGTDAQRDRWLPGLAAGKIVGAAVASTETGGGSNPLSTRMTARPDGDGWVLDGSKQFITLAGAADLHIVTARTSDAPAWMAKIAATEAALHVIDRSLSVHGLAGFTRGLPLERNLRDARALCIHWGNNDVLRNSLRQLSVA